MLTSALLAFALSLIVCPAVILALGRLELVDRPNARSSHDVPVPRGAGLAVAVAVLAAASFSPSLSAWRTPLILASAAFGVLGLVEDLRGVSWIGRLLAQGLIAAAVVPLLIRDLSGPDPWRLVFTCGVVLWLVSYVNAFNFMDGINGISVMQVVVAGGSWWAIGNAKGVPGLAYGAAIVLGATVAFAPFNVLRARAFLGDVGSYFLGAWLAVLVVIGLRAGLPPEAVVAPVGVALADTLGTLVSRVRRGEPWHESHREHVYQRLVGAGWSHTATTLFVGGVLLVSSALGATAMTSRTFPARLATDLAIATLLLGYMVSPDLAARRGSARRAAAVATERPR